MESLNSKYGTEQIEKVLDVVVEAGNVAEKIVKEGGGVISKVSHLLKLADELIKVAGLVPSQLKLEFADLDANEKEKLMAHMKEKFDLENDALEAKIEAGLDLAVEAEEFIAKVVKFVKPAAPVVA